MHATVFASTVEFEQMLRSEQRLLILAGCEELMVTSAFRTFADNLIGVINASISKFHNLGEVIHRSELQEYTDTHVLRLRKLDGLSWGAVRKVEVDVPAGMSGTYAAALEQLRAAYTTLNMEITAKTFADIVKKLKVAAAADECDRFDGVLVRQFVSRLTEQHERLTDQLQAIQKQFSGERTGKVQLHLVVQDPKELRETLRGMLGTAERLTRLGALSAIYRDATKDLETIRMRAEAVEKLERSTLTAVAEMVRYMAFYYEMYGIIATIQAALEHNYTLVLDSVLAEIPA